MNLSIEDRGDHVLIRGRSFVSVAEATQHFDELQAALVRIRAAGRCVRALVDLREFAPQSAAVAALIQERTKRIYGPTDRVAILAASAILQLQLKRIHAEQKFGVFLDERRALMFLAHEAPVTDAA